MASSLAALALGLVALTAQAQTLSRNGGFELPSLAASSYRYAPFTEGWTFLPGSGVASNASAFTAGNAPAPQGAQVAFLQSLGSIRQQIDFPDPGYYALDFRSAQRANFFVSSAGQRIRLSLDDAPIAEHGPPTFAYDDAYYTFYAEAGPHTLAMSGTSRSDETALVDGVVVQPRTWGFWDPGLVSGAVKTGYLRATKGTAEDPLSLSAPCLWPADDPMAITPCNTSPSTYAGSFPFAQNTTFDAPGAYWVLAINNEPAQDSCNPGPPNLSLSRSPPGHGIAGFEIIPDTGGAVPFKRAHLVLNQTAAPNPCAGGITYLSFGAQANRGNRTPIVAVNPARGVPSTVAFVAKVWAFVPGSPSWFRLVMLSAWPDATGRSVARIIQLNLFAGGLDGFGHSHWNWPVEDDFMPHGGADVAYIDADRASALCGLNLPLLDAIGEEIAYRVDVDALFRCVSDHAGFSDPMPGTPNLAVSGVHWAVENSGPPSVPAYGAIWVSVHGMKVVAPDGDRTYAKSRASLSQGPADAGRAVPRYVGPSIVELKARLRDDPQRAR